MGSCVRNGRNVRLSANRCEPEKGCGCAQPSCIVNLFVQIPLALALCGGVGGKIEARVCGLRLPVFGPGSRYFKLGKFAAGTSRQARNVVYNLRLQDEARIGALTGDALRWKLQVFVREFTYEAAPAGSRTIPRRFCACAARDGRIVLCAIAEAAGGLFVQLAARHPRKTDCGPFKPGHAVLDWDTIEERAAACFGGLSTP